MQISTNCLVTVAGYLETGRVMAIEIAPGWDDQPTTKVSVEIGESTIWVDLCQITGCRRMDETCGDKRLMRFIDTGGIDGYLESDD